MNLEEFKPLFGKWYDIFEPFLKTSDFDDIYKHLKERSKKGHKIIPASKDVYNAFKLTDPSKIKAIFIGFAPYDNFDKVGRMYADGLTFSASRSTETPKELKLFLKELKNQYPDIGEFNDLTAYPSMENILMLNASFTCELNKEAIHHNIKLWDKFNEYLYKEILGSYCGIPIVTFGKEAAKLTKHLFPLCHVIKHVEHPTTAVKEHREWNSDNCFTWVNQILKENNNDQIDFDPTQLPF
jgi:uracil DNA glycosylase